VRVGHVAFVPRPWLHRGVCRRRQPQPHERLDVHRANAGTEAYRGQRAWLDGCLIETRRWAACQWPPDGHPVVRGQMRSVGRWKDAQGSRAPPETSRRRRTTRLVLQSEAPGHTRLNVSSRDIKRIKRARRALNVEYVPEWKSQEGKSARESGACSRARDLGPARAQDLLSSRILSFRRAPSAALLRCHGSR
jgi:hypothetical protein